MTQYIGLDASINTGGLFVPNSNSWTPTTSTNAPEARHTVIGIWTGSNMIAYSATFRFFRDAALVVEVKT